MKRAVLTFMAMIPAIGILAATPTEKAVEAAANSFSSFLVQGNMVEVFSLLPDSYQKDVSSVVSAFGRTVDAELWNEGRSVLVALADIGIAQPKLIAQMALGGDSEPTEDEVAMVASAAQAIQELSGTLSLEVLQVGDVAKLLARPEVSKITALIRMLDRDLSADTVQSVALGEDGVAKVVYDEDIDDATFVLVEGKWIPEELADDWDGKVAKMLEGVSGLKIDDAKKQQILAALPMMKVALAGAKNVTTKEQLQQSIMMVAMPLMMMNMN